VKNPLDQFAIKKIIPLELFGYDISFTNASLMMVLGTLGLIAFQAIALRRRTLIPQRLQAFYEVIYDFTSGLLKDTAGEEAMRYFPLIFSLFTFVLLGNMMGMVPYSFTFTSHIIVTFSLALLVFIFVTMVGLLRHGWHFFRLFFPEGIPIGVAPILIPIEIITYFMRPVTLGIRLCANMLAGHVLLKMFAAFTISLGIAGVFPLAFNVLFTAFEFFVAFLQAYIFAILTCVYLNDALHLH
jgi:F-type H+-transporting ATPase subunit a